jgi:hypothetical protein
MEDSSSSDDSDLEDILFDDDEQLLLMLVAKEEEDNKRIKWPGSKVSRLCIPRNRTGMRSSFQTADAGRTKLADGVSNRKKSKSPPILGLVWY